MRTSEYQKLYGLRNKETGKMIDGNIDIVEFE